MRGVSLFLLGAAALAAAPVAAALDPRPFVAVVKPAVGAPCAATRVSATWLVTSPGCAAAAAAAGSSVTVLDGTGATASVVASLPTRDASGTALPSGPWLLQVDIPLKNGSLTAPLSAGSFAAAWYGGRVERADIVVVAANGAQSMLAATRSRTPSGEGEVTGTPSACTLQDGAPVFADVSQSGVATWLDVPLVGVVDGPRSSCSTVRILALDGAAQYIGDIQSRDAQEVPGTPLLTPFSHMLETNVVGTRYATVPVRYVEEDNSFLWSVFFFFLVLTVVVWAMVPCLAPVPAQPALIINRRYAEWTPYSPPPSTTGQPLPPTSTAGQPPPSVGSLVFRIN